MPNEQIEVLDARLTQETVIEIGKFAVLWCAFEKDQCGNECSPNKIIEMEGRIEKLNKIPFKKLADELKKRSEHLRLDIDNYVKTNLYPKHGARITPKDKEEYMPTVIEFITSKGNNRPIGALLAIYRIRNNIFHGLKDLHFLDDQRELFKAISAVLEEIIKPRNHELT